TGSSRLPPKGTRMPCIIWLGSIRRASGSSAARTLLWPGAARRLRWGTPLLESSWRLCKALGDRRYLTYLQQGVRMARQGVALWPRIRLLDSLLLVSFFLSGLSALMYQVSWQRSLYGVIGVDIDSITIIVSMFMLGVGLGGMLGGWIADLAPGYRIQIYAAAELSIALFGFCSLWLLQIIESAIGTGGIISRSMGSLAFLA